MKKLLSVVLSLLILLHSFPSSIFAQENQEQNELKPMLVYEIPEKRESNIKQFLREDFSAVAAVYPQPVHYLDEGQWKDIDNTLVEMTDESGNLVYTNKANSFQATFARSGNTEKLATIKKDSSSISLQLRGVFETTPQVSPSQAVDHLPYEEQLITLPRLVSSISYPGIYEDIDLLYRLSPAGIKQEILILNPEAEHEFSLTLTTSNLAAELLPDNTISLTNLDESGNPDMYITGLYAHDASGEPAPCPNVNLTPVEEGYELTITADSDWLAEPGRVFPVNIGFSIDTGPERPVRSGYVSQDCPDTTFTSSRVVTGNLEGLGETRTFLGFNLPRLEDSDQLLEAYLTLLNQTFDPQTGEVFLHQVTAAWSPDTLTWQNMPEYDLGGISSSYRSDQRYAVWPVTGMAIQWYSTGGNYGVVFQNEGSEPTPHEFAPLDADDVLIRPLLTFVYTAGGDSAGEEGLDEEPGPVDPGEFKPSGKLQLVDDIFEKREINIKHFLCDDLTYEAVIYPEAVHYRNSEGKWADIDNTLSESIDEEENAVLQNKSNSFQVRFAQTTAARQLVSLRQGKHALSWNLQKINRTNPVVAPLRDTSNLPAKEARKVLTRLSSTVDYPEIYPGVDLQYQVRPEAIKESIIIKEPIPDTNFTFDLYTKNLAAELQEDNSIVFFDPGDPEKQLFAMQAPFMVDARGEHSSEITVSLER